MQFFVGPLARNLQMVFFLVSVNLGVAVFAFVLWPIVQNLYVGASTFSGVTMVPVEWPGFYSMLLICGAGLHLSLKVRFARRGVVEGWFFRRKLMPWSAIRSIRKTWADVEFASVDRTMRISVVDFRHIDAALAELQRRAPNAALTIELPPTLTPSMARSHGLNILRTGVGFWSFSIALAVILAESFGWHIDVGLFIGAALALFLWRVRRHEPMWMARAVDNRMPLIVTAFIPTGMLGYFLLLNRPAELPGNQETVLGLILGVVSTAMVLFGLMSLQYQAAPDELPESDADPNTRGGES